MLIRIPGATLKRTQIPRDPSKLRFRFQGQRRRTLVLFVPATPAPGAHLEVGNDVRQNYAVLQLWERRIRPVAQSCPKLLDLGIALCSLNQVPDYVCLLLAENLSHCLNH